MLSTFLWLLAAGYYLLMLAVVFLTRRLKPFPSRTDLDISVIVCARNESQRLGPTLESLSRVDYPRGRWEVILVDDGSTDDTAAIMKAYAARHSHWRVLHHVKNTDEPRGKKAALAMGIAQARGSVILTTDADCQVPSTWLKSMAGCFDAQVGMVLGFAIVQPAATFFQRLQQFGCVCEATVAAVSALMRRPTHSNGQNLAFRKDVFYEVGGYADGAHISSGDDFFLSKAIQLKSRWRFVFNISPASFVTTWPEKLDRNFIHQQLRRNGKAFYLPPLHFFLASWIFLFHLGLLLALFVAPVIFLKMILIKFGVELLAFSAGARVFGQKQLLPFFPLFWLLYPLQIISTAVLGSWQKYRWK